MTDFYGVLMLIVFLFRKQQQQQQQLKSPDVFFSRVAIQLALVDLD